jgi:acyl carrier protein
LDKKNIYNEIADYFNVSNSCIFDATVASDVNGWDSLTHVMLILHIEEIYNVEFTPVELSKLENVYSFYILLNEKLTK